jgi:uncharacterized protein YciI
MTDLHAQAQVLKDKMWGRHYYVMIRTIVDPGVIPGIIPEHLQWLISLEKRNLIFASGPLFDTSDKQTGGMTVFRTESLQETDEIAVEDPLISSGAMNYEIQRWQINEGRINVSIDFSDQTFTAS